MCVRWPVGVWIIRKKQKNKKGRCTLYVNDGFSRQEHPVRGNVTNSPIILSAKVLNRAESLVNVRVHLLDRAKVRD